MSPFLTEPEMIPVYEKGGKQEFAISDRPLVVHYGGERPTDKTVQAFMDRWSENNKISPVTKDRLSLLVEKYFAINTVWVVPAGRVTDGPSVPPFLRWYIDPTDFYLSGVFHDWFRGHCRLGNPTTDGALRDLAQAEGLNYWKALNVYWGVRIGDRFLNYKCRVPNNLDVTRTYADHLKRKPEEFWFDAKEFEVKYL